MGLVEKEIEIHNEDFLSFFMCYKKYLLQKERETTIIIFIFYLLTRITLFIMHQRSVFLMSVFHVFSHIIVCITRGYAKSRKPELVESAKFGRDRLPEGVLSYDT